MVQRTIATLAFIAATLLLGTRPLGAAAPLGGASSRDPRWVTYPGGEGPGAGRHVVLVAGDEEYRSEEQLPQLAKILSLHHGFRCTVLFSQDPETGEIDPTESSHIPGLEVLAEADLLVLFVRFRRLPEADMQHIVDFVESGKPVFGIRTATHAFNYEPDSPSPYAHWSFRSPEWSGGFGRQVLGETWVAHHGRHGIESTRGVIPEAARTHPILRGVSDIWGPTDVYAIRDLPGDATVLVEGAVLAGMDPVSLAVDDERNHPRMPLAWIRERAIEGGSVQRIVCSTIGSSTDFASAGVRRLFVNACYWAVGLESQIPAESEVSIVGTYSPRPFGFDGFVRGVWPRDHALERDPTRDPAGSRPERGPRVVLLGGGLGSRMQHFGRFETELHLRYPEHRLFVRNLCDEGNTPGFRPHSGRADQLGFPGAEAFIAPYTDGNSADGVGHFETEEQWLTRLEPDVLICFFGFSESFEGLGGLENFRGELAAFLEHTQRQTYGGDAPPRLVLVSPTAFEDRSEALGVPSGLAENSNLAAYTSVMEAVAGEHDVEFVNVFNVSLDWYADSRKPLTVDGALLADAGYARLAEHLADTIFGAAPRRTPADSELVRAAVMEKNWFWINDFKIPNGVHVFGRRHDPFGPANYPFEQQKLRELTAIRDEAIWAAARGETIELVARDAATSTLPPVETNYTLVEDESDLTFLTGDEALATIVVPEGYRIEQWATEVEFPDLANPVQLSFDNQGRLWVATMPSYPHYRPGDPRPDDKLLILEDTDGDGKADRQTVWADGLHLPMGFEFAPEGVYLSQGVNLVLLSDTDGDDRADRREVVFSGFDDHDTHHAISAYCADPSGAIVMCEGTFLRSNIETPYGTVRGTNGGFFRFAPQRRHLERHAQLSIPNPWGVAFDGWGQHFFLHTSGPTTEWMLPGTIRPRYGVATPGSQNLIEPDHRVRPTAGLEFLSSRHFPDEVQGDLLLNNTIGFLGTKQHRVEEDGTGFSTTWRQDLTRSSDPNFRPVDIEVAPDGSLYLVDWHNPLIGHMQHNARDPLRDHAHGRIYRITYPGRALVEPARIAGAPLETLLENLELPEYRSRYRTRRELRGRDAGEVLAALETWVAELDPADPGFEHNLLEALWVTWGLDRIDEALLRRLLEARDPRARAAAARVLRYSGHRVAEQAELLEQVAGDSHGRVQLEAIAAASWLDRDQGLAVLAAAAAVHATESAQEGPRHVEFEGFGREVRLRHPALTEAAVSTLRITLPGEGRILNLVELEVTSAGADVTADLTVTQSSEYEGGSYPAGNLVDGDRSNFSHTSTETSPWIEVQLDPPRPIDTLTIWNRPGYERRFDGALVEFLDGAHSLVTLEVDLDHGTGILADPWLRAPFLTTEAHLKGQSIVEVVEVEPPLHLTDAAREQFVRGAEIYARDGHCSTCHQPDGLGLRAGGFPPLAASPWVTEDEDRLIKLTLNGLLGPMEVMGESYSGLVPMTPFGGMLDDQELADVLTYARNSFGNRATPISAQKVAEVRAATATKLGFYSPEELEGGTGLSSRPFVKFWEPADFDDALAVPLRGRDFARGAELFEVASCTTCHSLDGPDGPDGIGRLVEVDLGRAGAQYSSAELLEQILEPSALIRDEHRLHRFELADGSEYFGMIVARGDASVTIVESVQEPDVTVDLELDQVVEQVPLETSPMPTGLLVTLTREEILDLLAYVAAGGYEQHPAFSR